VNIALRPAAAADMDFVRTVHHDHLLDARLWVQTDQTEIDRRNEARGADEGWLEEELPWVAAHRPWEHADSSSPARGHFPTIPASRS
jgi:hypothetical protein